MTPAPVAQPPPLLAIIAASERLDQLVAERRQSFECIDGAKRRAAMLKHTRAQS